MTATWVLLRGLTRETGHWGGFVDTLRSRLRDVRIVPVDLPGNGRLHHEPSPTRVQGLLTHCRAQLQAAGEAPPYDVFAMSLGAMVAIEWAVAFPDELSTCVLVNTSLRGISPPWQRLRPESLWVLMRLMMRQTMPHTTRAADDRAWEAAILRLTTRCVDDEAAQLRDWLALRRDRPVSRANALRQLIAAARYRVPGSKPDVPMLLLASPRDSLVDVRCSRSLALRWQLPIVEHPSAGHDLPLDDAEWTAARVAEWRRTINREAR